MSLLDSTYSTLYFSAFFLSVFLFPFSDEQQPLNKKIMENLCESANNEGEGTYDVLYLPTGCEPKAHDFDELQNSSVPLSFKIPAADQDADNLTLGGMLSEEYRGQVDYFVQGGVSVSQLSSSVRSDRSGQLDGELVDQGNLMSVTARKHRLGLYLRSKDRQLLRNIAKKSVIRSSMQLTQKKSADSYKDNYGNRNLNFVKLINEVSQRWNYGNSRVLPSILSWNSPAEYRNCKMK